MTDHSEIQETVSANPFDEVGIYTHLDGTINLTKSLKYIARKMTQRGHSVPKAFVGKPYADAWWGPENFTVLDVENYFTKFDIDIDHDAVVKGLAELVRKGILSPVYDEDEDGGEKRLRNTFRAGNAML